jgi:LPPG:FO 2-phospho-L-lactate transferase
MYAVLSGGTGTPKLLMGMQQHAGPGFFEVIANTAEDTWASATFLSPDVDSVTYALAGVIDQEKWYGVAGDSFAGHEALARLGHRELLRMGDRDRATKLYRTMRLSEGATLSQVTDEICAALGVAERVHPMTDGRVATRVGTERGELAFHDFWVRDRAAHTVTGVRYEGIENVACSPGALEALTRCEAVLIGPSNPVTSIGPILSVPGVRDICKKKRVVAVSPMRGEGAFSGPAAVLMQGLGVPASTVGVAQLYGDILDEIVIDRTDAAATPFLERMGLTVHMADTEMKDLYTRKALGSYIMDVLVN